MGSFIQARNVTLAFKPKNREPITALNNFNLDVARGEFVSIVGPSGCGKSTFLNILLGLIEPDNGQMQLNGTRITGPSQERAHGLPEFGLLPWRTVTATLNWVWAEGVPAEQRLANELIKLVGLSGFERHYLTLRGINNGWPR
jgi:NitT/TauT family transport system ATP-binding protein